MANRDVRGLVLDAFEEVKGGAAKVVACLNQRGYYGISESLAREVLNTLDAYRALNARFTNPPAVPMIVTKARPFDSFQSGRSHFRLACREPARHFGSCGRIFPVRLGSVDPR